MKSEQYIKELYPLLVGFHFIENVLLVYIFK